MENTVVQISVDELRKITSEVVEEKFAKYSDPDYGLELRDDFVEMMIQQQRDYDEGKLELYTMEEVLADLGINKAEIESEENIPAQVY